ncbi:hypothetical protein PS943_05560 [Pseudomonas fluorescens]|jgi:hypothetical protein|uniref:Uncharacterized protein n=2 Tax=Pseudomonas TaxID=286 RepID=A0A1H4PRW9_PSEJE|nr:hypothetical protein SAMN04490187_3170 [Pseudomonas jessenii]VVQ38023.1 hypothetical protein PS943_05560 [Pseudomonas fluorescens]
MNFLCSEDASAEGGLLRHFFEIAASGRQAGLLSLNHTEASFDI